MTTYVLYLNDIIRFEETVNADNIADIEMPNRDGFIRPDPRPDIQIAEPCMSNCADSVEIKNRATDIGVTPNDRGHPTLVALPPSLQPDQDGGAASGQ